MNRTIVRMDRPIYVGLAISKTTMYRIHYDFMKLYVQPTECLKILCIDTESFILIIKNIDPYTEIIKKYAHEFDTSNYAEDNRWGIARANKKIPRHFKDENGGSLMTHFIGLGSKCYTFKVANIPDVCKIEGVKRPVVQKRITYDDMYKCLFVGIVVSREQTTIRSRKHELTTEKQKKVVLRPEDTKRCLLLE